jgi:hypothetical protein
MTIKHINLKMPCKKNKKTPLVHLLNNYSFNNGSRKKKFKQRKIMGIYCTFSNKRVVAVMYILKHANLTITVIAIICLQFVFWPSAGYLHFFSLFYLDARWIDMQ